MALLFSVAVNIAVAGTMIFFWRHKQPAPMELNIERVRQLDDSDLVWFHRPDIPAPVSDVIDSLRQRYHIELQALENKVDAGRQEIVRILLKTPVDEALLDNSIARLADSQQKAEQLTINHLLAIKPLLPENEWRLFLNDLEPQHKIRTKIIKLNNDSSQFFIDETEMHIFNDNENKKIIIEHKQNSFKK